MSGIFPGGSDPGEPGSFSQTPIIIFDVVAAVSTFSSFATFVAAWFNPTVTRSNAWYNMMLTLGVFPLLYLTNVMFQFHGKDPPFGLCLFQGGLIYGGPPAACVAVVCYILDLALSLRACLFNLTRSARSGIGLLCVPILVFQLVFYLAVMLVTSTKTIAFDSAHMFCGAGAGSNHDRLSAGLTIGSLLLMLGIEVWIIVMISKKWRIFRSFGRNNRDLQLSVFVRFGIFTLLIGGCGIMAAFIIPENAYAGAIWNIFLVTVPLVAVLAFGTHKELLRTWVYWLTGRPLSSLKQYSGGQTPLTVTQYSGGGENYSTSEV